MVAGGRLMPAQHLPSFSYVENEGKPESPAQAVGARQQLDHNMLRQNLPLVLCQDRCPFDYVTQLTYIARPGVLQQLEGSF
jgi:hypothetical protein